MPSSFKKLFEESVKTKQACIDYGFQPLESMGNLITQSIQSGKKLMLCGNGGSAADAQHLAAEMLVRLRPKNNREGIPAIVLAQDTSTITACGNDFGYDQLYERMVSSLGKEGDCLIGITTSGNSENVIKAIAIIASPIPPQLDFVSFSLNRIIPVIALRIMTPILTIGNT